MKKFIAAVLMSLTVGALFAGFWDWSTPYKGPEKDVMTLIITGNYKSPRAMADLIQIESNQPYILLPYAGSKGIFFCPGGKDTEALEIEADKLVNFISLLGAKRIVILGDERYVDPQYRRLLEANGFSPVTFTGPWKKVAADVATMMRLQRLERNFAKVQQETSENYLPGQGKVVDEPTKVVTVELLEEN